MCFSLDAKYLSELKDASISLSLLERLKEKCGAPQMDFLSKKINYVDKNKYR